MNNLFVVCDSAKTEFQTAVHEKFSELLAGWTTVAEEARSLDLNLVYESSRDGKNNDEVARMLMESGQPMWMQGWGPSRSRWLTWGIMYEDAFPFGEALMPETVRFLSAIKGIKVAAISLFKPSTILGIHTHPELRRDGLHTFHLGLSVAGECALCVDNQLVFEQDGRGICFDGSLPHYAYNASSENRFLLYCEFSSDA